MQREGLILTWAKGILGWDLIHPAEGLKKYMNILILPDELQKKEHRDFSPK